MTSRTPAETSTGGALAYVHDTMLTEQNGMRADAKRIPRVVILITDGEPTDRTTQASANKLKEKGAEFYVIFIAKNCDDLTGQDKNLCEGSAKSARDLFKARVSKPVDKHFFELSGIDFVPSLVGEISQSLCTQTIDLAPCCSETSMDWVSLEPGYFQYFSTPCSDTSAVFKVIVEAESAAMKFEVYVLLETDDTSESLPGPLDGQHDEKSTDVNQRVKTLRFTAPKSKTLKIAVRGQGAITTKIRLRFELDFSAALIFDDLRDRELGPEFEIGSEDPSIATTTISASTAPDPRSTSAVDVSKYYSNTQGARWGRDFRSGNPGETNYWIVGPLAVSNVSEITFEYEYVVAYSWNCGWSRYTGFVDCEGDADPSRGMYSNGSVMNVYIRSACADYSKSNTMTQQQTLIYSSGMLKHYPYDNCKANGGWGDVATKNDGCYSPAVKIKSTRQSDGSWAMSEDTKMTYARGNVDAGEPGATRPQSRTDTYPNSIYDAALFDFSLSRVEIVFEFVNNRRNMHLNPHHMDMQVLATKSYSPCKTTTTTADVAYDDESDTTLQDTPCAVSSAANTAATAISTTVTTPIATTTALQDTPRSTTTTTTTTNPQTNGTVASEPDPSNASNIAAGTDSSNSSSSNGATIGGVVAGVLLTAAAIAAFIFYRKRASTAVPARHRAGTADEIVEGELRRNTMGMEENPLGAARRAKAASANRPANAYHDPAAAAAATATTTTTTPLRAARSSRQFAKKTVANTVVNAMYAVPEPSRATTGSRFSTNIKVGSEHPTAAAAAAAASAPEYATIDESNYMVYLNAFAGGATGDIYGELAALGQIPSSGTLYATVVESNVPVYATPAEAAEAGAAVYDASRSGAMYDKASAYQLKTAYNQKYMDRQVSHLTEAQRWARLAKMAQAMAAHQGEYDALFAKWSASAWIEDLDVQHRIVVRNIAADAVVQPNPWASAEPASTLSRAGAVTSKRYLLKLLGVYNQKEEGSPVPMIAAACREIVAKLGDGAVRFKLGKTKDQGRIFEKVLANEGRFDLIRDYARATFVVKDVAEFPRLLQHLLMDETFKVVRVKNRLSRSWDSRASAGYRDYQVLVQTKEGWIMELQLIPKAMYKLKSKLGHNDYTQYRFIIEAGQRARGKGTNAVGGDQEC